MNPILGGLLSSLRGVKKAPEVFHLHITKADNRCLEYRPVPEKSGRISTVNGHINQIIFQQTPVKGGLQKYFRSIGGTVTAQGGTPAESPWSCDSTMLQQEISSQYLKGL